MEFFYVGDRFYRDSGTMMSSIYTTDFRRAHWGQVEMALKEGQKVEIRPANKMEMTWAKEELKAELARQGRRKIGQLKAGPGYCVCGRPDTGVPHIWSSGCPVEKQ